MKSTIASLVVVAIALLSAPALASAETKNLLTKQELEKKLRREQAQKKRLARMKLYKKEMASKGGKSPTHKVPVVPELDPGALGSMFALLAGGTIVLLERRRSVVRRPGYQSASV